MLPESGTALEKIRYHWGWCSADFNLWVSAAHLGGRLDHRNENPQAEACATKNVVRERALKNHSF
jgi:hypothetical protein